MSYTVDNFRDDLSKRNYNVIVFGASWCNPCRLLDTQIKSLLEDNERLHKYKYIKIDFDDESFKEFKGFFEVEKIPHVLIQDEHNVRNLGTCNIEKLKQYI